MRFPGIRQKLYQVGFDDFYQAGSISRFHPMNIVAESRSLNLQFWVCADGGYGVSETYHISERPLDDCNAPTKRTDFRLCAALLYRADRKKCVLCGGYYLPKSNRAKYCPDCSIRMKRAKATERKRKQRQNCHPLALKVP